MHQVYLQLLSFTAEGITLLLVAIYGTRQVFTLVFTAKTNKCTD
uniref:Uncharacterized protein n=1 Tax=Nelumbo nucifera TaxID=4432 RepID=A0A822YU92_NELNU|nr:TPA_asm: hypothetical protein HUJ06_006720 [Nelumbo nucifera]